MFILTTVNLDVIDTMDGHDQYRVIGIESFIAYSDCRKRGERNLQMLENVGIRGGFSCPQLLEKL